MPEAERSLATAARPHTVARTMTIVTGCRSPIGYFIGTASWLM